MTTDEKLAAILAAIQTDPGNRGLGKVPGENLFTACPGDFAAACRSIAEHPSPAVTVYTGFFIPSAMPAAFETDGPLGAVFLARALTPRGIPGIVIGEVPVGRAVRAGLYEAGLLRRPEVEQTLADDTQLMGVPWMPSVPLNEYRATHLVAVERPGPAADGRYLTMRGMDVGVSMRRAHGPFAKKPDGVTTIGIGDGGNEIGMGKVPRETVAANIPNGDLVHCRVATDFLVVAGVSNWGAYALAAGVYAIRGVTPPADLFDPDRERALLEVMVKEGPLVDGVSGGRAATVDGLAWEEYVKPLVRMREVLEA
jgi:hypothetical protein